MAGSAADTPTTPEFVRVSDMDRDRAVDELRKEFVDGRLSHDTFLVRMHAALDARNHGELSGLFSDLPPRLGWLARARQAVGRWRHGARERTPDDRARDAWYGGSQHGGAQHRGAQYTGLQYEEEPRPVPALPEPVSAPKPLMFPPGADTSFTIGRDQRCDLYIADMTVSRLHARLARGPDGWLLTDLGSSNGTRVNGWRLRAAVPVQPGDTITFGSAVFILQPEEQLGGPPGSRPGGQLSEAADGQDGGAAEEGNRGHLEG
jgi:hypothetical protein